MGVTTCRSLIKATTRQRVGNLGEEAAGCGRRRALATDVLAGKIDFAPHQPEAPEGIHREDAPEEVHSALLGGAPHEDDLPAQRRLEIQLPGGREGAPISLTSIALIYAIAHTNIQFCIHPQPPRSDVGRRAPTRYVPPHPRI